MAKILITGGSGLVGGAISAALRRNGHEVVWLGRQAGSFEGIRIYRWDLGTGHIDHDTLNGVEHVIHLAGANIAGQRWNKRYKRELAESRLKSTGLLLRHLTTNNIQLKSYVGASAAGYYGTKTDDRIRTESDRPGDDFLATLCVAWEDAHAGMSAVSDRVVILRSAVVLARDGGALRKMLPVFRAGLGAPVAPGHQAFPWIHIADQAAIYEKACFDEKMTGVYNSVAPETVTNEVFSEALAAACKKRCWLPPVPGVLLRAAFGEAATTLTTGVALSPGKILRSGFGFRFGALNDALRDLIEGKAT